MAVANCSSQALFTEAKSEGAKCVPGNLELFIAIKTLIVTFIINIVIKSLFQI